MELEKNGFYARFWKWFYVDDYLPRSLCRFFWTFLIALIFTIPVGIIVLPACLLEYYKYIKRDKTYEWDQYFEGFIDRIKCGCGCWIGILIVYIYIRGFLHICQGWYDTMYADCFQGMSYILIAISLFILFLIKGEKLDIKKPKFIEIPQKAIKGFIEKNCPRINWI